MMNSGISTRLYGELRRLAAAHLRRERDDHSLETTALVHEAYLRLAGQDDISWQNRAHFFGIMARTMRQLLVDRARRRLSAKRHGLRVPLEDLPVAGPERSEELLALDEALVCLAAAAPEEARVVELRFFGGLSREETAEVLGLSVPTVSRRWRFARAWLYRFLEGER